VFDDIRACPMPADVAGVHAVLDEVKAGRPPVQASEVIEELNQELVFGGAAPRDVPGYYYSRILAIIRGQPAESGRGVPYT
jgi:hypothetical protein